MKNLLFGLGLLLLAHTSMATECSVYADSPGARGNYNQPVITHFKMFAGSAQEEVFIFKGSLTYTSAEVLSSKEAWHALDGADIVTFEKRGDNGLKIRFGVLNASRETIDDSPAVQTASVVTLIAPNQEYSVVCK